MGADARQAAELKKLKKNKKTVLSFSVNATKRPTGVRKKWFPPMSVASLEALLFKFFGFYSESCSAPAPAPVLATFIGFLIFFPEALGTASRARFLYQKTNTNTKNNHQDLTRPCPLGRRI